MFLNETLHGPLNGLYEILLILLTQAGYYSCLDMVRFFANGLQNKKMKNT